MISVYYLIVCVNLLYSFAQDDISPIKTWKEVHEAQEFILKSINVENQYEYLAERVTPYWKLPYDEQLDRKQNHCHGVIDMIVERSKSLNNPKTNILLKILPSPVTKGYVNRDIFNVRNGVDGNPKTVGLVVGKLSVGRVVTVHPLKLIATKESHKRVAQVYEDFIRLSPLPANHKLYDGGYWRTLLVRSNEAGEILVAVTVHPVGFIKETIEEQQYALKEYFFKHLPNISLFYQRCLFSRCTQTQAPYILLYGKSYFIENLNGCKFKISPDTFFQINKFGAEVMYNKVIKMAKLEPNTTLLDLYSGTGTVSIIMSKFVKEVIAMEYNPQARTDAEENAQLNNVHNIVFLLGGAERKLKSVLQRLYPTNGIVVIVTAGDVRPGMDVIKVIRRSPQINRLVYITGKPDNPNSVNNFVALCLNETLEFPPFRLTKAIPVDILPQTAEVNLVLLFER